MSGSFTLFSPCEPFKDRVPNSTLFDASAKFIIHSRTSMFAYCLPSGSDFLTTYLVNSTPFDSQHVNIGSWSFLEGTTKEELLQAAFIAQCDDRKSNGGELFLSSKWFSHLNNKKKNIGKWCLLGKNLSEHLCVLWKMVPNDLNYSACNLLMGWWMQDPCVCDFWLLNCKSCILSRFSHAEV